MENLVTCSKILYDKDICDKMEEITYLKKKLKIYETPKIEYSSWKEFQLAKNKAFVIIKNAIDIWCIEENDFLYYHNIMGLEMWTSWSGLHRSIKQAINLLSREKEEEWANYISNKIIYGILGFFYGLRKSILLNMLLNEMTPEKIRDLAYNNIIWQLDHNDEYDSYSILEDFVEFTCLRCKKKTNMVSDVDFCYNCEDIFL